MLCGEDKLWGETAFAGVGRADLDKERVCGVLEGMRDVLWSISRVVGGICAEGIYVYVMAL